MPILYFHFLPAHGKFPLINNVLLPILPFEMMMVSQPFAAGASLRVAWHGRGTSEQAPGLTNRWEPVRFDSLQIDPSRLRFGPVSNRPKFKI